MTSVPQATCRFHLSLFNTRPQSNSLRSPGVGYPGGWALFTPSLPTRATSPRRRGLRVRVGWEVAAAAVSFTLWHPGPSAPFSESLAISTSAAGRRRQGVDDSGTDCTAGCRRWPTAESPKCRWRLARGQIALRGLQAMGAEGVIRAEWGAGATGSDLGGWQCESVGAAPVGSGCPRGARGRPVDMLARSPLGSPGFCQPAADVGAPLPSSPFTTAGRLLCATPPSLAPATRVPTPCRGCKRRHRVESRLWDPRVLLKESASEEAGVLRGGVGEGRERERAGKGHRFPAPWLRATRTRLLAK